MKIKITSIILLGILFILCACSKKVKEEKILNKIEKFSGLKINKEYVDSITYQNDYSYVDYVDLYTLYLNEKHINKIKKQLNELSNFTNYNDTLISYSIFKNGTVKQVNFILNRKIISYSTSHL